MQADNTAPRAAAASTHCYLHLLGFCRKWARSLTPLQGGANAGHTIYDEKGTKYALHLVPSGILNKQAMCVVGNGVVVHLPGLFEEIETLAQQGVQVDVSTPL